MSELKKLKLIKRKTKESFNFIEVCAGCGV